MNNYDRILKLEFAINKLNAKIYACNKVADEYSDLLKDNICSPKKKITIDTTKYSYICLKRMCELDTLKKIKRNLVKAQIRHIKEQAEEYRELQLPEIRSLLHAIDNLK